MPALLVLALAGCGGRERIDAADTDVPAAVDDGPQGTLPTPEAAPGTSVTGMPTQAPPVAAAEPAAPTAEEAGALPAPVDETTPAAVDPAAAVDPSSTAAVAPAVDATGTTPASPAAPSTTASIAPADAVGAGTAVTQYMSALSAGAFAKAQALWSATPNDSAVLQLARGDAFAVSVGAPLADAVGHVAVPVDVRGKADDGSDRHVQVTYTLTRVPNGPWRIQTAAVRDASP